MILVLAIFSVLIPVVLLFLVFRRLGGFSLSQSFSSFEYVYVESDGSVRELQEDEISYLKEEFDPGDGARPYIKHSYTQLTPDGKVHGFIKRAKVPAHIRIRPAAQKATEQKRA